MKRLLVALVLVSGLHGCHEKTREIIRETEWLPIPIEKPSKPPPPLPPRIDKFIGIPWFEQEQVADVESLPEVDRVFIRWIWNNRFNEQVSDAELGAARDGVALGVNSVSGERRKVIPQRIGSTKQIYRIDIRDYGWTRKQWVRIENELAIPVQSGTTRGRTLAFHTQTAVPWVYAPDFFKTIFNGIPNPKYPGKPGLYYDLLNQPGVNSLAEFHDGIGINFQEQFDNQDAVCEGDFPSDIALGKKRLVCSTEVTDGLLYGTYDIDKGGDSLLLNPFPKEARSERTFIHAAQEWIYPLSNQCHGYRLNATADQGGAGEAQGEAPVTVVINRRAASLGLSPIIDLLACSGCHNRIKAFKGKLGAHIASAAADFDQDDKRRGEIFIDNVTMEARISRGTTDFNSFCLEGLGITPSDIDPINRITDPYRLDQNIKQIAAYFFLPTGRFGQLLSASGDAGAQLGTLLTAGGVIGFDDFTKAFPDVLIGLNLFIDKDQVN